MLTKHGMHFRCMMMNRHLIWTLMDCLPFTRKRWRPKLKVGIWNVAWTETLILSGFAGLVSPSAAISKQEATFVTNLLDSLSQSTTATDLSSGPPSKQTPHQPNPPKKRKKNQHDNKKQREGRGDLYAVQAMLSSDGQVIDQKGVNDMLTRLF